MLKQGDRALIANNTHEALLYVKDLKLYFPIRRGLLQRQVGLVKAVDGVTFDVRRGETLGLVGESGCGKTTAGRTIVRLYQATEGKIIFEGEDISKLKGARLQRKRRNLQMIFQDPYASLNPRMTVQAIVGEPLVVHRLASGRILTERVSELLKIVGLSPYARYRYPHEFSGGQRQRIGIARALAAEPSFIVCDEPISALDVSIQAQIVNLLKDLQAQFGLTYLFIAHDLSMVRYISDRVAVMYLGQLMELADQNAIYTEPLHPYTAALLSAVPVPDPEIEEQREQIVLSGELPSPAEPPAGCPFHTRCPLVVDLCRRQKPEFREVRPNHFVACHRTDEAGPGTGLPVMTPLGGFLEDSSL
jgi:oligopeptide transport system ATP-binding protein